MRSLRYVLVVAAFLVAGVHECEAQIADPMANAKLWPMMYIDDEGLVPGDFPLVTFPDSVWRTTKACAAAQGIDTGGARKPDLRVVPVAHSIRVHDLTIDSIVTASAPDSVAANFVGKFTSPTIAYTLLNRNLVLITSEALTNVETLTHEALHALLWQSRASPNVAAVWRSGDWHPEFAFGPCVPGFLTAERKTGGTR